MLRLLLGVLLLPLSASLFWAAAKALAGVAIGASAAAPFTAGLGLMTVAYLLGRHVIEPEGKLGWGMRTARWMYVLGHELTHALAAWTSGGSVFAIHVEEKGGHVDLSHSSAFVALAPYCVPFHALAVVAGYRVLIWARPQAQAEALFLLLMGGALAFHALMTWETLTQVKQPDLDDAGGSVFSFALIGMANGLVVLLLLKTLFPESVALTAALDASGRRAWWFWTKAWTLAWPAAKDLWRRVRS
ncbi:MAG TPA: hypothetical protein VN915_09110 [Elusimicrobiota bacterium]|nr:hypothetical protein [Elusimicrobiota bacterium]